MNEVKCCIKVDNFAKLRFLSSKKSCYAVRKWPLRNIILGNHLRCLLCDLLYRYIGCEVPRPSVQKLHENMHKDATNPVYNMLNDKRGQCYLRDQNRVKIS